jgi:hypothetical protein
VSVAIVMMKKLIMKKSNLLNIKIKTNKRDRFIGKLDYETKTFYKEVKKSVHLFKKLDAWGIDAKFFNDVLLPNNFTIHIFSKDEQIDYYISAEKFKKYSQHFHFIEEEDNRAQIFCSRVHFSSLPRG